MTDPSYNWIILFFFVGVSNNINYQVKNCRYTLQKIEIFRNTYLLKIFLNALREGVKQKSCYLVLYKYLQCCTKVFALFIVLEQNRVKAFSECYMRGLRNLSYRVRAKPCCKMPWCRRATVHIIIKLMINFSKYNLNLVSIHLFSEKVS